MGAAALMFFEEAGKLFHLLMSAMGFAFSSVYRRKVVSPRHVFHEMILSGASSLPIISLVSLAVGMILALQAAYQLKQFGAVLYTGGLVSVSITRELGPLVAAIVISGRVGARMAAELGTMQVQEEIDALITMGLNPVRHLVVPKFLALIVMLPCLTVMADVIGMAGGFLIGTFAVKINPDFYIAQNFDVLVLKDVYTGLLKSFIFALLIVLISCHQGLSVRGGAEGVGRATTQAVVISITLIIIVDCLMTAIFYYALPG